MRCASPSLIVNVYFWPFSMMMGSARSPLRTSGPCRSEKPQADRVTCAACYLGMPGLVRITVPVQSATSHLLIDSLKAVRDNQYLATLGMVWAGLVFQWGAFALRPTAVLVVPCTLPASVSAGCS